MKTLKQTMAALSLVLAYDTCTAASEESINSYIDAVANGKTGNQEDITDIDFFYNGI